MNLLFESEYKGYEKFFNDCININESFNSVKVRITDNITDFKSIVICSEATIYRSKIDSVMIGRIKLTGKKPYISFKNKYLYWFINKNIDYYAVKSDVGYFRVGIDKFEKIKNDNTFSKLIIDMCLDAMSFNSFGCCSKYVECSDRIQCLHSDQLYSNACMYRKNLEAGKIFYGKNKNV